MTAIAWTALTRDDLNAILPSAVVVLPTGSTEQHGPHLVTAVDAAIVDEAARRGADAATRPENVVVAPTLAYGMSEHHLPFGGTLSLSFSTYYAMLGDLVRSLATEGARRVLLLNGHGGNATACAQVAADGAREHGIAVAAANIWELATPSGPWSYYPGHAGAFETSLMLALRPEGVHLDRSRPSPGAVPGTVPGLRLETPSLWQSIDGFTDVPSEASAEVGAVALDEIAEAVARAIECLAAADCGPA